MGQLGFFDVERRYNELKKGGNPLEPLESVIRWEIFRKPLKRLFWSEKKSEAGRKPYDYLFMFKILVLQRLYGLSDEQMQYQINDRLSFQKFLDIGPEDMVPDAKTIWLFRERLTQAGLVEKLFSRFEEHLNDKGYTAQKGTLVDASIVQVPIQRNKDDENKSIKAGEVPEEWKENPNKLEQKDVDARWTKKYGKSFFGYKNHINVDRKYRMVRAYTVTSASAHESSVAKEILNTANTNKTAWGDSAYDTEEIRNYLFEKGVKVRIQRQSRSTYRITKRQARANKAWSLVRRKVEHVFGYQVNTMKANYIRSIGLRRAKATIGLNNLVHNIMRYLQVQGFRRSLA